MQLFQKLMLMKYLNINGLRFIKTCPKNKILLSNSKEQASFILKILIRHLKLQNSLQEIQISKYWGKIALIFSKILKKQKS